MTRTLWTSKKLSIPILIVLVFLGVGLFTIVMAANLNQTQISQLYVSIFGRASEGEGNVYWQTNQPDMSTAASKMLATPAAQTYFGSSLDSDQAFIEHIFLNTLNKTLVDDSAGIAYWVSELGQGKSRGEVVAKLVEAIQNYAPNGAGWNNPDIDIPKTKAAYDQFINRVEISNYMADTIYKAPSDWETSTSFSSNLTVTDDAATVAASKNIIQVMAWPSSLATKWETAKGILNVPESVVHDNSKKVIYVANINTPANGSNWADNAGFISKLSESGEITEAQWVTGLKAPKGMAINGNSLYVADLNTVVEIDTVSGTISNVFAAPDGTNNLNDLAYDNTKNVIYVSDSSDKQIFEVSTAGVFSLFYDKETENNPNPYQNGLYVDGKRLIMNGQSGVVKSINTETKVVELIYSGLDTSLDGIWKYKDIGYFVSDWVGKIYFVSNSGVEKVLLTTAPTYSADISYSSELNLILVPDFNDRIVAYEVK